MWRIEDTTLRMRAHYECAEPSLNGKGEPVMHTTELQVMFRTLSDEELSDRSASGDLTDDAQALADAELVTRGLPVPTRQAVLAPQPMDYQGDLTIVAKNLSPTEAYMLCACLQAGGVPAETADTNLVQTNTLLSIAVGGASVRVPANFVGEARAVMAAYEHGDFALDDDFAVGEIAP
jgi:hypothetical protein